MIAYFGDSPLATITPFDVKNMAVALYPKAINSTRNRQGLAPARAVLIHAYERGWCNLMRLTRFREDAPRRKTPASPAWLQIFVRQGTGKALPCSSRPMCTPRTLGGLSPTGSMPLSLGTISDYAASPLSAPAFGEIRSGAGRAATLGDLRK